MKIIVTGSLGNISKPLTEKLVKAGHQVTVVSSNEDRSAEIKALGASPAIGSVNDVKFLTDTFTGADAVYAMIPPNFTAPNWRAYIGGIGSNYAEAIKASGVKKVVYLSSIGAHLPTGTGPIAGIHDGEETLNALTGVAIKHLRPAFFYLNFYGNVDMIKHANIIGSNYSGKMVLVHPEDIAEVAAEEIQSDFTGKTVRYIASDERTTADIAAELGKAIGKPNLPWVEFNDDDAFNGMVQAGLPEEIAKNYVEMGTAIRNGKLQEDYEKHKPAALGKIKLEDFAAEFAKAF
ncbi:MAG TPA: NAD(P)H-binding protein [Mucilaginibacter sp.]|nr:NAD(P)H-binding protein [Mucilaginibacter sp.]